MANPWDNDPIVGASQGGPVYGAPPKADIPSGYAPAPGGLRPIPGGPADPSRAAPPSGYRFTHDGSLEPIPGGPADPNKDAPKIGASSVTGPDYLKTLDPGTANMVQALASGRKAFPSGSALRAPYWQQMLAHVSNYDPGFDEVNYTSRAATRRDFTSGKAANNIRALNTAIGHLGHLAEQVDGTASHGFTPLNAIENTALRLTGDPGPTNFDATVSALAGELTAVYRGSGGAEADIQRYVQQLSPNASHEQKLGTIRNIVGLLKSRLDALNDQYRQGMGTTAQQLQLLDPQAQLIVHHLGGFDTAGAPDQGGHPPDGPGAGFSAPPPPTGPAPGMGPSSDGFSDKPDPQSAAFWEGAAKQGIPYRHALDLWQREVAGRGLRGTTPPPPDTYGKVVAYIKQNPNVEYHPFSAFTHAPVSKTDQAITDAAFSAPGAFALNAANGFTAGIPTAAAGDQGKYFEAVSQQQHPIASTAGDIVGSTAGMLSGEAGLARAGMGAGLGREIVANSLYGAVRGGAENPDNPASGAVLGALSGTAGTVAGNALTRGAGAILRGVTNKDANALMQAGVGPLTVGQVAGGRTKAVEDKVMSAIGGGSILARRSEGYRSFNTKAFDKALEPIGANVDGAVGEDAVAKAHEAVKQAFSSALAGKSAVPDEQFITAARGPMQRLATNKRVGPEIVQEIEATTQGLFDDKTGALSGENMQAFLQGLRQIRQGYKADPLYKSLIEPSIKGVENAVEGMFKRQAPEVMPQFNAAKAAYRRLSILSDAVNRGKNTDGVFTPSQLGMADRGNAKKYDGAISAASGESPFFDLQRAAQNTLPSEVPNSGTADRLAALKMAGGIGALATGGATAGYLGGDTKTGVEGGLGLAGVLAALYSKRGQAFLVNALVKRPQAAREAGTALRRVSPYAGAGGAAVAQESGRGP